MRKAIITIIVIIYLILLSYIYFLKFNYFPIPRITIIASSSMKLNLNVGDAVIVIKVNPEEIKIGDIISYNKVIPYMSSKYNNS